MSRIFAISDIHGHVAGLRLLLEQACYNPGTDTLVLLGDYIDAEPETWNALSFVRALTDEGAVALAGNKELSLIEQMEKERLAAADVKEAAFLRRLPLYVLKEPYLFVHAGLRPGVALERQTASDLTNIRREFWDSDSGFPHAVVFGHTPTHHVGASPGQLWCGPGRLGIDTGAKHGMRLTLVELTRQVAYSCATDPSNLYGDVRKTGWAGSNATFSTSRICPTH